MPWRPPCPQCGAECAEGARRCAHCGAELADSPPPAPVYIAAGTERLATLHDNTEIGLVEGLLRDRDIPVYFKHLGPAGQYMRIATGLSAAGAEAYVPADRLEEAREAIAVLELAAPELHAPADAVPGPAGPDEPAPAGQPRRARRAIAWFFLVVFLAGTLLAAPGLIAEFARLMGGMLAQMFD